MLATDMESNKDLITSIINGVDPTKKSDLIKKIHPATPIDSLKRTAIHYMAIYNNYSYLQEYYKLWKDIEVRKASLVPDTFGRIPLHYAVAHGVSDITKSLIVFGKDSLDTPTIGRETPLMKAAYCCQKSAFTSLVEKNAKLHVTNACGHTATDIAKMMGQQFI